MLSLGVSARPGFALSALRLALALALSLSPLISRIAIASEPWEQKVGSRRTSPASNRGLELGVDAIRFCKSGATLPARRDLKIVSYNIKVGQHTSFAQVVQALRGMDFDILALQEVDHMNIRSGFVDQPGDIARSLGLCGEFFAALDYGVFGRYGIAILSRVPLARSGWVRLPQPKEGKNPEQRIAGWIELPVEDGRPLFVVNTHLSLHVNDRVKEAGAILEKLDPLRGSDLVLTGDLNDVPGSPTLLAFENPRLPAKLAFEDVLKQLGIAPVPTFPSAGPRVQIDHFLLHGAIRPVALRTLPALASDHAPLELTLQR